MTALQGTNRIYVFDQQLFLTRVKWSIIHELFVAQIIDFGSLVLDRNLDQTFPAGAIVRATPQEVHRADGQNRQSTHGIPMDNKGISNQDGDRSRLLPDPPVENTSEIDAETSPLKAWLLRGMNRHGKAHWTDCCKYYNEHQPAVAELDKSFRPPKPEQMRLALSMITSLPGYLEDLVKAVDEIRSFEQTFIRIMKGLTPSCVLYAKLLFNGVCECLRILREETTASGQAEKQFNKKAEEANFHPQLESHVVTWVTNILPRYVETGHTVEGQSLVLGYILLNTTSHCCPNQGNRLGNLAILSDILPRSVKVQQMSAVTLRIGEHLSRNWTSWPTGFLLRKTWRQLLQG